jgi:hypothetical protein
VPNNAMNQPNRGVPGMKVGRASGEPVLAEVGPPFMLSLDVAGYCSVRRTTAAWSVPGQESRASDKGSEG